MNDLSGQHNRRPIWLHTDDFYLPHACSNGELNKNQYKPGWRSIKTYNMVSNKKERRKRKGCKFFGAKTLNSTSLASQSTQALVSSGILNPVIRRGRETHRKSSLLSGGGRVVLQTLLPANCSWIRGWSSRRGAWGATGVRKELWS